jgi:hypothetical protein
MTTGISAAAESTAQGHAVDLLARTIWGEARGESVRGQEAVAAVVMNRLARAVAKGGYWWGNSVAEICLKPRQFSCWNSADANWPALLLVAPPDPGFECCQRIARRAVAGSLGDCTGQATHYQANDVSPRWAAGHVPSAWVGRHLFYNDIL